MEWLETVVRSAFPVLLTMSVVGLAVPAGRPRRLWRGLGWAWLAVVVSGFLLTLTHLGGIGCALDLVWRGAGNGTGVVPGPCVEQDALPLWQVALPPVLGIGVLLAWVGRQTRPAGRALRTASVMLASSMFVVAAGQIDGNLALLALVLVVAAGYALPRLRDAIRPAKVPSAGEP